MDIAALAGATVVRSLGVKVGSFLGKQLVLGGSRDDLPDDLPPRPFVPRVAEGALPRAVDLRRWMTRVEDQGELGSCTANALGSAVEYLVARQTGTPADLSRLFLYYNQRLWGGTVREDSGSHLGWGLRVLTRLGVPTETMWPYSADLFAVQPPPEVYRAAAEHRVVEYQHVPITPLGVRAALAEGFPVAFGIQLFEEFFKLGPDGVVPMPTGDRSDGKHGRHAMLIVGYDDGARLFAVRNSWGTDFGDQGYCYIPYDYLLDPKLTRNCCTVRTATDLTFEADDHCTQHLASTPRAPAPDGSLPGPAGALGALAGLLGGGKGTAVDIATRLAANHAGTAVGMLTGSAVAGQLLGGMVSGLAPAVRSWALGNDSGVVGGRDLAPDILAQLKADPATGEAVRAPWDDGMDEESALGHGTQAGAGAAGHAQPGHPVAPAGAAPGGHPAAPGSHPAAPDYRGGLPLDVAIPPGIRAAWEAAGGPAGALGAPRGPAARGEAAGRAVDAVAFERGVAFDWHPAPGEPDHPPFAIPADDCTLVRWLELGGPHAAVGFPVQPPTPIAGGRGTLLACSGGAIVATESAAPVLTGALYQAWWASGAADGALGLPTASEWDTGDPARPRACRFEGGTLVLRADGGVDRA